MFLVLWPAVTPPQLWTGNECAGEGGGGKRNGKGEVEGHERTAFGVFTH